MVLGLGFDLGDNFLFPRALCSAMYRWVALTVGPGTKLHVSVGHNHAAYVSVLAMVGHA